MSEVERRGAVRVPAKLAMEIKVGAGVAKVQSLNVSANGVYFVTPTHIPVLTKLSITLLLPDDDRPDGQSVSCEGVVVRIEPEEPDSSHEDYSIACYFTDILKSDQQKLESYILKQLAF